MLNPIISSPLGLVDAGQSPHLKGLIIHGDDFGLAESVNDATISALESGALSSASIMVPCPYFSEAATYASRHPEHDIGVHLTITSEWPRYRWGPVAPRESVSSLIDAEGLFFASSEEVADRAKPDEVELELIAQIEHARALGVRPTHLDSHMFALFQNPELYSVYVAMARNFDLQFITIKDPLRGASQVSSGDVTVHTVFSAYPSLAPAKWERAHVRTIELLRPGISEFVLHLGFDTATLRAAIGDKEAWASAWRQRDFTVITGAAFQEALQSNQVLQWRWCDIARRGEQPAHLRRCPIPSKRP